MYTVHCTVYIGSYALGTCHLPTIDFDVFKLFTTSLINKASDRCNPSRDQGFIGEGIP